MCATCPSCCIPAILSSSTTPKSCPLGFRPVAPLGGAAEILLLEERDDGSWEALAKPSKKLKPGDVVTAEGLAVEMGEDLGDGRRVVRLDPGDADLHGRLAEVGLPPLPPYIEDQIDDPSRYQTVYADRPLSAAAPTAGLHFTPAVLDALQARGIDVATVELAVGLDTFRPVMVDRLDDHVMHSEWYRVPDETVAAVEAAERVVAIGTTVVRSLESWKATGEQSGRAASSFDARTHGRRSTSCSPTFTCLSRRCCASSTASSALAGGRSTRQRSPRTIAF